MKGMALMGMAAIFGLLVAAGCGDDTAEDDGSSGGNSASSSGNGGAGGATTSSSSASSSGSGGGGNSDCFDYSTFTPMADVSFADDIMPIFADSCNSNNCHGDQNNPDAGVYLGEQGTGNTPAIIQAVYDNLVGVNSQVSTNLQRVVPGDAENSWLMVKLDGEMDCPQVMCVSNGCGQRMPRGQNAQPLPENELTLVRSWILNGAPAP